MQYREIIDTIKVGDVIEHKSDGHLIVDKIDIDDRGMTLRCGCWKENSNIIRKVPQQELSTPQEDSQNENDDSQCGNEIVVGSKWVCVKADPDIDCDISIGGVYSVVDVYGDNTKWVTFVDDADEEQEWLSAGFKKQFKPVEQSTEQLKEQLSSQELSGGARVGANIVGVPLTPYAVYVPARHKCPRNKYDREIVKGVFVDVYDVLDAFDVKDPCLQHLIKKALALGIRGHKDALEDYQDIVDSANRGLEKYKEKHL